MTGKMIDGRCTFFFNGNWLECCVWHDLMCADAWLRRSAAMRLEADRELRRCVTAKGRPAIAAIMYAGVRLWAILQGGY